ncbi:MAG: FAD-dependent oxidoreductase [Candidatus Methanoperedens sp.]|nr:FAD-dependent oxidoreductase [Candidatus Methanoperedens sp.]
MKYETSVSEIIERTHDVKSFRFNRAQGFDYDPGQFLFVTILSEGKKITKHFTISSSPTEKECIEFTKKITDHEFSVALDRLKIGDRAYLDGPYGDFAFKGEYPRVGMITGGIGITPLRSMIKYCTDEGMKSRITFLYGNRNQESIVFKEELDHLKKLNQNLRVIHTLSQPDEKWTGRRGHIDVQMVLEEIPDYEECVFYVCGPPSLVTNSVEILKTLKIQDDMIHKENFPGY